LCGSGCHALKDRSWAATCQVLLQKNMTGGRLHQRVLIAADSRAAPPQTWPLSDRESAVLQGKGVQEMPSGKKVASEQVIGEFRVGESLG
jgi:hypothetical protein